METIAFDSHKRYTLCRVEDAKGSLIEEHRIEHERGMITEYLRRFTPGSAVAVETIGNWYWIVDEIEQAGMRPLLVHARRAKMMMCNVNKTDKLDARGLNILQRAGTLPTVWIPPAELRDLRDLFRGRMYLVSQRTRLKNRIHAVLARHALEPHGFSDMFGKGGRAEIERRLALLPARTSFALKEMLGHLDEVEGRIEAFEERLRDEIGETEDARLLRTIPGVGFLLGSVIALEMGDVNRFAGPGCFTSYSGCVPRVHSSGGRTCHGGLRSDVNRYLKWAFMEAANVVSMNRGRTPMTFSVRLYEKVRARGGHPKAIGAVARHLAESAYWVMRKKEEYKDRPLRGSSSAGT